MDLNAFEGTPHNSKIVATCFSTVSKQVKEEVRQTPGPPPWENTSCKAKKRYARL